MANKYLTEKELQDFWENFDGVGSEDEDFSDIDDLEDPPFQPNETEDGNNDVEDPHMDAIEENIQEPPIQSRLLEQQEENVSSTKKKYTNILWKKKYLELNNERLNFQGDLEIPAEILKLETPYQFFKYFITEELLDRIVNETNLYCAQKNIYKPQMLNKIDIRQYIGILTYMSIVHMPNTRSYWSDELEFSKIKNVMTINKFEKIRQSIHFNDNETYILPNNPGFDCLHKIRPILDHLRSKFHTVPLELHLSIDEQMCSTKVKHYMKQYMPMKPHKWGFKFFILAGVSGFAYNFEIYTGKEKFETISRGEPDLGVTGNIVTRLARIIPRNKNYRLYYDNYYTSIPLMVYLAKEGIYSLGTIRKNRITNSKLPSETALKSEKRGTSFEYVSHVDGVDVSSLIWKDNKYVTLISSFAGTNPLGKIKRYDRKEKQNIYIDCPFIIQEYNKHMGGVDLLDSLIGRYKIKIKSKKWHIRIFYHILDLTIVNSWLLYKRVLENKNKNDILNQAQFRAYVANCLCTVGTTTLCKRGRPSSADTSVEFNLKIKNKKRPTQYVPPKDVRMDQFSHWPIMIENQTRCKYPNCKGSSRTKCEKCGVALCYNNKNNCFKKFHIN